MEIKVTKRNLTGKKTKELTSTNILPGIISGPTKKESMMIQMDPKEFKNLFDKAGFNKLIEVNVEKESKPFKCIIREIQYHPVTDKIIHVGFFEPDLSRPITAEVPVVIKGVSKAIKDNIGFLVTPVDYVLVRALPEKLPDEITIDISNLEKIGDNILLKDIVFPEGVTPAMENIETVSLVFIAPPQKEIVEEEKVAEETVEGEVKEEGKEGKVAEGGEEGAEEEAEKAEEKKE